ncbi:restriction endonuclease subunit S [Dickeya undicola]|nr:restriction endonuclease subunit S [Dickeya undicola]
MQNPVTEKQQSGAAGKAVPAGFKLTEVGVIPEDWEVCSLGELSISIVSGKTCTQGNGEYPLYGSTGLIGTCEFGEYEGNALLIARVGANAGRLNFVTGEYGVSDNTLIVNIKPKYNITFFYYILLQKKLNTLIFGSGQPLITSSLLKKIIIAVPCNNNEQTSIADALTEVDELITKLERFIIKKQAIKTATMQQLLTGKTRLPQFSLREDGTIKGYKKSELGEIPEDWSIFSIGDIADVKTGPFGSSLHEKDYVLDGTPIITVEHLGELGITYQNLPMVSDKDKNRLRPYQLNEGDIVFSRVGSVDRNGLICKDQSGWLFSGRLLRVRLKNALHNPAYLSFQFHSAPFKKRVIEVAVGQTMPSLNTTILKGIAVIMPEYEEQTAIAAILSDMDQDIQTLQQRLEKNRQLKQGMMQALLTGKTRLI